jgi:hypothetical protein
MSTWTLTSSWLMSKSREFEVKERFGKVQKNRTRTGPLMKVQNPEPFSGLVLAGEGTMDQTTENRTKSPVQTVVLDRTAAALSIYAGPFLQATCTYISRGRQLFDHSSTVSFTFSSSSLSNSAMTPFAAA